MQIVLDVIEGPHSGQRFSFDGHDNFIVGRARCAHFRLPKKDPYFSRVHFMVEINPPCCRLIDSESTNGNWAEVRKIPAGSQQLARTAFSPDGRLLAAIEESAVVLYDTTSGQKTLQLPGYYRTSRTVFSPDGQWLAIAGDRGSVVVWDIRPEKPDAE